jgi:hypothetical protein
MNINISDTTTTRQISAVSQVKKTPDGLDENTPFSQLLRNKEVAGDVAAIVAKNSILTQAEKSILVQANTTTDVALTLLK